MEAAGGDPHLLAQELGDVLARLSGFLRRAILPKEMSLTQALVLSTLRQRGPQRITELAESEGVRQPTCTGVVNTMEAEKWVARRLDSSDRRAVLVELTTRGRQVLEGLTVARAAVLERYLKGLSGEERRALAAALPALEKLIEVGARDQAPTGGARHRD
jgi:DNA-binding MarR family transcriptional regulator